MKSTQSTCFSDEFDKQVRTKQYEKEKKHETLRNAKIIPSRE